MKKLGNILRQTNDTGAAMVEYALLVALIALIAFSAVTMLGHATESTFVAVGEQLAYDDVNTGNPGGPVKPGNPDKPADADEKGDEGGSGNPGNPGNDGNPSDPSDPGDKEEPANPESPDDPSDPSNPDDPSDPDDRGGSGGSGGSRNPGGGSSEPEKPAEPGSEANSSGTNAGFYWWNDTAKGGEGAWTASVTFDNDWIRHQYLTIEVTTIDHNGKRVTTKVTDFYVPANGSATYTQWNNDLKVVNGASTGVVAVEFKVVSVRTSDVNWQTVTYPVSNPQPIQVKAPV